MTKPPTPEGVNPAKWALLATAHGDDWHILERNADGEVVGTSIRKPDGSKATKPGGKRGLILDWELPNYAGSSARDPILVCEGASDTAAAMTLGFDAVGVPMAGHCGAWLAEVLRDRHVVIVADADDAGRRGAGKIAAALLSYAASVRIIESPVGTKDLRAWVIEGAERGDVLGLIDDAAPMKPAPTDGEPVLLCMGDVQAAPVRWLWAGRIPLRRMSLLVGRPGEGKSFASADFAARVSTGENWPDSAPCEPGSVLLVSAEDDPADTIRPRLDAHGADARRVYLLSAVHHLREGGRIVEAGFTLADLEPLRQALERIGDVRLIVIDPIGSYVGGRVDAHRDNEVREVLAPLGALAQSCGAAVLLVAHQRKSAASHADDLVLGSRAFTGIARSVLHLLRDPDDESRRLLLPGKMNLCAAAPGLAFTIKGDPARLHWEHGTVNVSAAEVLAAGNGSGSNTQDEAVEWLRDLLSEGPMPVKQIKAQAEADGFKWRTIERAKTRVGAQATREGFGSDGRWVWVNSAGLPKTAIGPKHRQEDPLAAYGGLCADESTNGVDADVWGRWGQGGATDRAD